MENLVLKEVLINALKSLNRLSNHDLSNKFFSLRSSYSLLRNDLRAKESIEVLNSDIELSQNRAINIFDIYAIIEEPKVKLKELENYFNLIGNEKMKISVEPEDYVIDDLSKHILMFFHKFALKNSNKSEKPEMIINFNKGLLIVKFERIKLKNNIDSVLDYPDSDFSLGLKIIKELIDISVLKIGIIQENNCLTVSF